MRNGRLTTVHAPEKNVRLLRQFIFRLNLLIDIGFLPKQGHVYEELPAVYEQWQLDFRLMALGGDDQIGYEKPSVIAVEENFA